MLTQKNTERDSSFELIRLLAQFYIIIYHIYLILTNHIESVFNHAIMIPMHIGVPVFVLISGYWGIRPSVKGFINLIGKMLVYTILLVYILDYKHIAAEGMKSYITNALIISNSPYWFMRTYICLYLFSPILNKFLQNVSKQQRLYALLTLSFISIYIGTITRNDFSLGDGKNLVNFTLLYLLGNTLHTYNTVWRSFNIKKVLATYFLLNASLLVLYIIANKTFWGATIWNLSFPYCSPFLIINSILFVTIVAKKTFYSKIINSLASSSLAIYLIHGSHFGMSIVLKPIVLKLYNSVNNEYIYLIIVCLLAFIVIAVCISIDKVLNPIWKLINQIAYHLNEKYVKVIYNQN